MKNKKIWIAIGALLIAAVAVSCFFIDGTPQKKPDSEGGRGTSQALPVMAAAASNGDIDVAINALGTVTALNTATVKARVDGQLIHINFRDGQLVKAGDLLAEIDPRPFQVQVDQTNGQLMRDQALLANARIDYERYAGLLAKDSIARQQVDAQKSLVRQYEGTVLTDRALVDNAKLQLDFTRITAPITGRLGLRQIDVGNMIHGSDTTGLVVITQTQPTFVIFAIPADSISSILERLNNKETLSVEAFDRDGKSRLASGKLLTVDNQIDATTGTVKLKAEFANTDNKLFPNQFVNARLRIETRHDSVLVPVAAVQRGTPGTFVYVVNADQSVSIRPVTLGTSTADTVAIEKGLAAGEQVVTDGADKLREGAKVEVSTPSAAQGAKAKGSNGGGQHKHRNPQGGSKENAAPAS